MLLMQDLASLRIRTVRAMLHTCFMRYARTNHCITELRMAVHALHLHAQLLNHVDLLTATYKTLRTCLLMFA